MYDAEHYRTKEEVEHWKERDPIHLWEQRLRDANMLSQSQLDEIEQAVAKEVAAAVDYAEASPREPEAELMRFVYAEALS